MLKKIHRLLNLWYVTLTVCSEKWSTGNSWAPCYCVWGGWLKVSHRKYHVVSFFFKTQAVWIFLLQQLEEECCSCTENTDSQQCLARTRHKIWKIMQKCKPPFLSFGTPSTALRAEMSGVREPSSRSVSCRPVDSLVLYEDPASSLSLFLFHPHFDKSLLKWEHFLCSLPQAQSSQGDKELWHYFVILKNWLGHPASTYQKM